jgi:outer membrane protein assembly factor BamA
MLSLVFSIFLSLTGISTAEYPPVQQDDTVKRLSKAPIQKDTLARFVKINRIFILGNKTTRERIVMRELTLRQGDIIYSSDLPEILEKDRKKLINTRLFNTVSIRTLELEKDQFDLLVDLKERWYTFPVPIFELSDRNFNEWWQNYNHDFNRVNYGLRLYQYNMRGRNETLRFVAQFGYQKRFELSYRIPNLDRDQKHGLAFDFDFSELKNVAVRTMAHKLEYLESPDIIRVTTGGGISYQFRNSFYETHTLKAEYRSVQIADTIIEENDQYLGGENINSQKYSSLTYQFTSDHRDYVAYPLHGYYFLGNVIKTGLTPKDDIDKLENNFTFAKFFDLNRNFFLSSSTNTYLSWPDKLPYYNYGALGYRKQFIQGYEVYLLEGPAYFVSKLTLKKRIFSQVYHFDLMPAEQFKHVPIAVYVKTYANIGYVKNYEDYENGKRLTNKLLSSVGAGLDIVTGYDLVLRLEYTFNSEGENGFVLHLKKEF